MQQRWVNRVYGKSIPFTQNANNAQSIQKVNIFCIKMPLGVAQIKYFLYLCSVNESTDCKSKYALIVL